jgi:hypothetical protein
VNCITHASSRRVPTLDGARSRGIYVEFYDPDGRRYGLPTYPYHWAPKGLLTVRQLRAQGLRPGGQQPAARPEARCSAATTTTARSGNPPWPPPGSCPTPRSTT